MFNVAQGKSWGKPLREESPGRTGNQPYLFIYMPNYVTENLKWYDQFTQHPTLKSKIRKGKGEIYIIIYKTTWASWKRVFFSAALKAFSCAVIVFSCLLSCFFFKSNQRRAFACAESAKSTSTWKHTICHL